jgi:hypothetical protein
MLPTSITCIFLTHLFFGITQEWQTYEDFSLRYSTSYVDPGHKMRDTFAFICSDFRVRLGTWQRSAPTVQPPLKSPQTTHYCNFLTHFIISIAVLENVPPHAGLEKRATFSTLKVGLACTRDQNWLHVYLLMLYILMLYILPVMQKPVFYVLPF